MATPRYAIRVHAAAGVLAEVALRFRCHRALRPAILA